MGTEMNVIDYNPWPPPYQPPPTQVWVTGPPSFMYGPAELAATRAYDAITAYYEALTAKLLAASDGDSS